MRLDQELVLRNIYPTRAKAAAAIKSGLVCVNGVVAKKPSCPISDTDVLTGGDLPYVSGRGSLKLSAALEKFNVNPMGYVCLDIGASTGGFTEVLLTRGASKVIAVDVGTAQLIPVLREDARVVSLEQTDIRNLEPFAAIDLVVSDVSFISLTNIADAVVKWAAPEMILLIKPQFEVSREIAVRANGVIRSPEYHQMAIDKVVSCFERLGYSLAGLVKSPIKGGSGNTEFLSYFKRIK